MLRARVQPMMLCVLLCAGLVAVVSHPALAATGDADSPLASGVVVPAIQSLDEGEQVTDAARARRASPSAYEARQISQTAYEHLTSAQAKKLAAQLFPQLINEPGGGPPPLPDGARFLGFPADNVAQVALAGGKRGVMESLEPIALQTAPHRYAPIDLQLHETGEGFQPAFPAVAVEIPKHPGKGIAIPSIGVSLTSVQPDGSPIGASATGEVDGASVIYPNTSVDSDTLVKPTTAGFSDETLLRSVNSPRQLFFRVGMPAGARLVQNPTSSGDFDVVDAGTTIAVVPHPSARDAEGTPVALSIRLVSADVLSVTVAAFAGYRMPIAVDPEVEDSIWQNEHYYETYYRTEWYFARGPEKEGTAFTAPEHPEGGSWTESIAGSHNEKEWGGLWYSTRGASQITVAKVEGHWNDTGAHIQNYVALYTAKGLEDYDALPVATESQGYGGYACEPSKNCPETTKGEAAPENSNTATYEQVSTGSGGGTGGSNTVTKAYVDISQEKSPELSFNTTSETIYNSKTGEYVPNVLYGHGSWLGPHHGAFEVRAKDPGIGLSLYRVLTAGWGEDREFFALGECIGIQCPEYDDQGYTYQTGMGEGVDSFEALAEDYAGLYAHIYPENIKVDASPPHGIKLTGFQNGNELPLGETKLKVEATDGSGEMKSSGIKSIKVSVDGHAIEGTAASCGEGPCTASSEFTLASRDYATGQHSLVVTATDNADNVAQEEFVFRVKGAAPVSVGPGTVDSSTGQLTLSASDVNLGGATGVSRTYKSDELQAGAGGPLGAQWALSVGGGEDLTVLTNGSAILNASGGTSTTFTLNTKGEYESPKGDSNLKLEPREKEYVLSDSTAGSKTKFEQPVSMQSAPPTLAEGFGQEASLAHPQGDAVDPSGDVWVTDYTSSLIDKFSRTGTLLGTYGSQGSGSGRFSDPWGIAADPRNGDIYVSDLGNDRIEELSPAGAFIKTFGWGVSNGAAELEICTKECRAGIAGSGAGQFNVPAGVTVDSSGNVWVVDNANDQIEEFNEKGEYLQKFGAAGSGAGQLSEPRYLTISGGHVYVADGANDRVDEFGEKGEFIKTFGYGVSNGESKLEVCTSSCRAGIAGSGTGQFNVPIGIATEPSSGNLYVGDFHNERVEEFTAAGAFLTTFGSDGSGPGQLQEVKSVAASASGGVYVVDYANGRVQEWDRPQWYPTEAGGALAASTTTYAYETVEEDIEGERKAVTRPKEALAPVPADVSCTPKLERGCRALTFDYATTKTAESINEGGWGEYPGRLSKVYLVAWNPATKAMTETAVAQYEYDVVGRLRAEWDPRIHPALKTRYGYTQETGLTINEESERVSSVSSPGQEPWLITYGTTEGDATRGRVSSISRPAASAPLGGPYKPVVSKLPTLSTSTPEVAVAVSVTKGEWSYSPLRYSYQWELCREAEAAGEYVSLSCEPIEGATNPTYTPLTSERGKILQARVTASNAIAAVEVCVPGDGGECKYVNKSETPLAKIGGSKELAQEPTPPAPAAEGDAIWTLEYHVPVAGHGLTAKEVEAWGQKDDPVEGVAVFPPDEPMGWPAADYKRATLSYFDAEGRLVNTVVPSGGIATSEYNKTNDVVRTLSADDRAAALKEGSKSAEDAKLWGTESKYNGESTAEQKAEEEEVNAGKRTAPEPGTELLETRGPQHKVKLAENGKEVLARSHVKYFYDEGSPNGKHYGLLTKKTDGAEYEGKEADIRTTENSYAGQNNFGWTLRKPTSETTEPAGLDLTKTTVYSEATGNVLETTTPAGNAKNPAPSYAFAFGTRGTGKEEFEKLDGDALDSSGNVWIANTGDNKVVKYTSVGKYVAAYGQVGEEALYEHPTGIAINQSTGDVYIADDGDYNRIVELSSAGKLVRYIGASGTGAGEVSEPWGVGLDAKGDLWVADRKNQRVDEFNEEGKFINAIGWGVSNGESKLQVCTTTCKAGLSGSGNGEFAAPSYVAVSGGNIYVSDKTNNRVEEFNEKLEFVRTIGSAGGGSGQFSEPGGLTFDSAGNLYVADTGNDRIQELTSTGTPIRSFGTSGSGNGQFSEPEGVTIAAAGKLYIADGGNTRMQEWVANAASHTNKIVYYSAESNTQYPSCGSHPEWANLTCETVPAQPESTGQGLAPLPVTTDTYNMWDEVESATETFGTTTRVKAQTYDGAGRDLISETTSSIDHSLPKVTDEYNTSTGALEKQSTTVESKTKTITSVTNTLGQLTSYTDANGETTKYVYEVDGRPEEVTNAKGTQTYGYNATTGYLTKLVDSAAGAFTAEYDPEGRITSEGYPGNMTASYVYNQAGEPIALEYKRAIKTLFTDGLTPSIHGETLQQESSLGTERYIYDNDGRLTQTQEELKEGKGCVTRLYAYDEESNRTSLTTREPGSEGKCATEGGTSQTHLYDTANRLYDNSVKYETFGNITALPATDAGKYEITSKYYVDNQLESQTENSTTTTYNYDPTGRTDETTAKGTTSILHYAGPGTAVNWTSEGGSVWTRDIPGIDGTLAAVQTSAGTTTVQLHDLQGNIVATTGLIESEGLLTSYNSTEFGVPQPGTTPPTYAWQGATGLTSGLPDGTAASTGASYVPLIGKPLQTQGLSSPGAFPNGAAIASVVQAAYLQTAAGQLKGLAAQHEAELEEAARRHSEEEAKLNECPATECDPSEGNPPSPSEGGAGESEEGTATGGDPFICEVVSPNPLPSKAGRFKVRGGYHCEADDETDEELLLHISAQVEVCLEEELAVLGVFGPDRCEETTYGDRQAAGLEYEASCSPGHNYRTWTWVFWWGVGPIYHNPAKRLSGVEKCT
jgi:YD repeat-containing protein